MAPNPRVADAFRAMKDLGIISESVKPVLKKLLKAYDNNWDFIEQENYRVLIDAIFEKDVEQVEQPRKKRLDCDAQLEELKKKRRHEEAQVAVMQKKPGNNQEVADEEAEVHGESDRPLKRLRKKYQETPIAISSLALLKPKEEPVTDNSLPLEASVAAINPEHRSNGAPESPYKRETNSSTLELASIASGEVKITMSCITPQGGRNFRMPCLDDLLKQMEDECLQAYKFLDPNFSIREIFNKLCECALKLGTTSTKESRKEKHVTPANGSSSKSTHVDVDALKKVPPTPKRSSLSQDEPQVEELRILCLPPTGKDIGVAKDNEQNGMESVKPQNLLELMPLETSSPICFIEDISKALETVVISLVNEVNNELPPTFRYISGNIKFEEADISFSLARIGENFCSTCSGECVSSPCACAQGTGAVVYDNEGLIKEDFLEECIWVEHDSLKQSLAYCKDCPLERSKEKDAKDGCKGHFVRKFIKECWLKCSCNGRCGNRIVQRGIKRKLQVFMTANGKRWGLRTLEELPRGAFVCEFAGEILTAKELYTRISRSSSTEKHEFPVLLDADWKGRVMKDEQALCLDASFYGNVTRFINHRCFDANLIGIPVEVDTSERHYYRFAFFTTRKVNAFEELTREYGIDFDDDGNRFKTFQCLCGSEFCRNLRRVTRSRSAKRRG